MAWSGTAERRSSGAAELFLAVCCVPFGTLPPRVRPVRGGSEGGITCVVTALLKVTRRRFAARFRARFRAFFLDPGIQPLPVPDPAPHGSSSAGSHTAHRDAVPQQGAGALPVRGEG